MTHYLQKQVRIDAAAGWRGVLGGRAKSGDDQKG
jgi:hypothetical protein